MGCGEPEDTIGGGDPMGSADPMRSGDPMDSGNMGGGDPSFCEHRASREIVKRGRHERPHLGPSLDGRLGDPSGDPSGGEHETCSKRHIKGTCLDLALAMCRTKTFTGSAPRG